MPKQKRIWWDDHTSEITRRSTMWASSDRGWLYRDGDKTCLGHYLDYGNKHYRSPHEYCFAVCRCRASQPGNVHAVCVTSRESRYFETVALAKKWIEEQAGVKEVAPSRLDLWHEKKEAKSA